MAVASPSPLLITGLPPEGSGVGRLMQQFALDPYWKDHWRWMGLYQIGRSLLNKHPFALVFSFLSTRIPGLRAICQYKLKRQAIAAGLIDQDRLVLLHPQTTGLPFVQWLIQQRTAPTWIYIVDSSFFCARQYNHIPGESTPCLKCLQGDFSFAKQYGCGRSSFGAASIAAFSKFLAVHTESGRVRFLVQNAAQKDLVRARFGSTAVVKVVGLWVKDFAEFAREDRAAASHSPARSSKSNRPVIVFHGKFDCAKGVLWAFQLAAQLPDFDFLFPFDRRTTVPSTWRNRIKRFFGSVPAKWGAPPPNCRFQAMTWETGLAEAVRTSFMTLTPSLWSAPVEGALLKSIKYAPRVGVVEADFAYSSDIPADVIHILPVDTVAAAGVIKSILVGSSVSQQSRQQTQSWLAEFVQQNQSSMDAIRSTVVAPGGFIAN